jgi:hypothetical protein
MPKESVTETAQQARRRSIATHDGELRQWPVRGMAERLDLQLALHERKEGGLVRRMPGDRKVRRVAPVLGLADLDLDLPTDVETCNLDVQPVSE